MKTLITTLFLFVSVGIFAGNIRNENSILRNVDHPTTLSKSSVVLDANSLVKKKYVTKETGTKKTNPKNIKSRTFKNLKGNNEGYYVIANVFQDVQNLHRSIKDLRSKGFKADYIYNAGNNLNYLYLKHYDQWQEALDACTSNLDGAYSGQVWIMNIDNSGYAKKTKASNDNKTLFALKANVNNTQSTQNKITQKFIKDNRAKSTEAIAYDFLDSPKEKSRLIVPSIRPNQSKLLQKADDYFDKMWYAEAAELYEQFLSKDKDNYSFEIIQKAGDAHYFNTNMERAYHWYNILYENFQEDMSADNIFKYAHSLKGTGKYARAKRLMRLYDKMQKDGSTSKSRAQYKADASANEILLDNILSRDPSFDIKNLAINSKYSDFAPMFHNEDQVVYASAKDSSFFNTRRYKWNNQPYLDLYVAKVNEESQDLKNAIKFSKKINTKYHEAAVTFSPDNRTMYFTRNNYGKKLKRDKKGVNNLKIYMSRKVDGEWLDAVELSFNSDDYSTGHPALSPDGKQLFFVSDMPGSIGQTDIFVVDVLGEGNFSEPKNLGPEINTERKEMFPFINNKKLYFSSNGHVGLGGLDVYEVAFDEEGFQEVQNVGQPVNSKKDDFSYIINEETQKGYFASNRRGGKGDDDIYSFKRLIVEEAEDNLNAIAGVVTELVTGYVMPEALVILLDENNIKLKEVVTADDGSFVFEDLDGNTKYTIKTTQGQFFDDERMVTTKENEQVNMDVSMRRLKELIVIEDGIKKLKTDMIYFNFDKSFIRKDASIELDKVVKVMNEFSEMVIKIESHTDSRGNNVYNKYLSDKRAKSTRAYLISKGIAADRIESAKGYGEERLINECGNGVRCSSLKHELNRRSEIIIVKM